jgi:hypothetical protein
MVFMLSLPLYLCNYDMAGRAPTGGVWHYKYIRLLIGDYHIPNPHITFMFVLMFSLIYSGSCIWYIHINKNKLLHSPFVFMFSIYNLHSYVYTVPIKLLLGRCFTIRYQHELLLELNHHKRWLEEILSRLKQKQRYITSYWLDSIYFSLTSPGH